MDIGEFFSALNRQPEKKESGLPIRDAQSFYEKTDEQIELPLKCGQSVIEYREFVWKKLWCTLAKAGNHGNIELEKLLFFDLETTGLSFGAGNLPFLVGLGFFKGTSFHVVQFFLHEQSGLVDMLQAVAEYFSDSRQLVSYNGKSFDWHILANKLRFFRIVDLPSPESHFDLLHIVRRIWRGMLGEFSLGMVERKVLKWHRQGDIESALIGEHYFRYLHSRDRLWIEPIIAHNRQDIISLVALFQLLERLVDQPVVPLPYLKNLLSVLDSRNAYRLGLDLIERYISNGGIVDDPLKVFHGRFLKKNGQWREAAAIWQGLNTQESLLGLAKIYEHKLRDYSRALACCQCLVQQNVTNTMAADLGIHIPQGVSGDELKQLRERMERLTYKIKFLS